MIHSSSTKHKALLHFLFHHLARQHPPISRFLPNLLISTPVPPHPHALYGLVHQSCLQPTYSVGTHPMAPPVHPLVLPLKTSSLNSSTDQPHCHSLRYSYKHASLKPTTLTCSSQNAYPSVPGVCTYWSVFLSFVFLKTGSHSVVLAVLELIM